MKRTVQPLHDSSVVTREPRCVASMRQTCTACTPIVEPVHPSSRPRTTERSTEVIVPGPALHTNRLPGSSSPSRRAAWTSGFQVGHRAMSESSAHTSPGDAEISTVPLAVIGAC